MAPTEFLLTTCMLACLTACLLIIIIIYRTCVNWNKQTGDWTTLPLTLSEERVYSSGWTHGDQLVIMGGASGAARDSSEKVSSDEAVSIRSFGMKFGVIW